MNHIRLPIVIIALLVCVGHGASAYALECVWTGLGATADWSRTANWTNCNAGRPSSQDIAIFPANTQRSVVENNVVGLELAGIRITGLSAPNRPYTIRGGSIALRGNLIISAPGSVFAGPEILSDLVISQDVELATTHPAGGMATLGKIILNDTDHRLTLNTAAPLAGFEPTTILGTGIVIKQGPGSLRLLDNGFFGPFEVAGGWVSALRPGAFGRSGVGNDTVVAAGAFIAVDASMTFDESFTFAGRGDGNNTGALRTRGAATTVTLNGPITFGQNVALGMTDGATLVLAGRASAAPGSPGFSVTGDGTVVLANTTSNWPGLAVLSGTVRLGAANTVPDTAQLAIMEDGTFEMANFSETIGSLDGLGRVRLGTGTLTVSGGGFTGVLEGSGNLVKTSAQLLTLGGPVANTFTGSTTVNGGELYLSKPNGVTALRGPIVVNSGALKSVFGDQIADGAPVTINAPGRWDVGLAHEIIGSLTGNGAVTFANGAPANFADLQIGASNASTTFSGTFSGTGRLSVSKVGAGTLTLTGTHTFTGGTLVSEGTLLVNGKLPASDSVLVAGGVLGGNGQVGAIGGPQGRTTSPVSPGTGTGAGILSARSATIGGSFIVDLNGPSAGSGYDQLRATERVTLQGNATLQVRGTFMPQKDSVLTIITSGQPITGTFGGLIEDAEVQVGSQRFRISYKNNSVTLTALDGPTSRSYYLSEGATSEFFDQDVLIANPNDEAVPVELTFFKENGEQVSASRTIGAQSHSLVHVNDIPGLAHATASTRVTSTNGLPLIVERSMFWDARYYAGHTGSAIEQPAQDWFFAEGAQGHFDTFVLIINPNDTDTEVTFTFLREDEPPLVEKRTVKAGSRLTLPAAELPGLQARAFGMTVHATQPIMAERAMYFGSLPGRTWGGGHASAGVTQPSTTWFLAEGATSSFFDTFVLLSNPQDARADVTVRFLLSTGETIETKKTLEPFARLTVNPKAETDTRLHEATLSTVVLSDIPIVAERSMYWIGRTAPWGESHNSFGVVEAATRWGLAEGRLGGRVPFSSYILLANPEPTAARVIVRFLRDNAAPLERIYTVEPTSRYTVDVAEIEELRNSAFGAVIEVENNIPIIVERSMYWDADGLRWSGGTNATGIRLP